MYGSAIVLAERLLKLPVVEMSDELLFAKVIYGTTKENCHT